MDNFLNPKTKTKDTNNASEPLRKNTFHKESVLTYPNDDILDAVQQKTVMLEDSVVKKNNKPNKKNFSMRTVQKERSNWYIYLFTFLTAAVVGIFIVFDHKNELFPESRKLEGGILDNRPGDVFNQNILFMLSETKDDYPKYFMLLAYRPGENIVYLIPMRENTVINSENNNTLRRTYSISGANGLVSSCSSYFSIPIDSYVKFDKDSFISYIDICGTVIMDIKESLQGDDFEIRQGIQPLSGKQIWNYITFPDFPGGESARSETIGIIFQKFINTNFRSLSVSHLQMRFNKIVNSTLNDISEDYFDENQTAYSYTSENLDEMVDYYIPSGDFLSDDAFVISKASMENIQKRMQKQEK